MAGHQRPGQLRFWHGGGRQHPPLSWAARCGAAPPGCAHSHGGEGRRRDRVRSAHALPGHQRIPGRHDPSRRLRPSGAVRAGRRSASLALSHWRPRRIDAGKTHLDGARPAHNVCALSPLSPTSRAAQRSRDAGASVASHHTHPAAVCRLSRFPFSTIRQRRSAVRHRWLIPRRRRPTGRTARHCRMPDYRLCGRAALSSARQRGADLYARLHADGRLVLALPAPQRARARPARYRRLLLAWPLPGAADPGGQGQKRSRHLDADPDRRTALGRLYAPGAPAKSLQRACARQREIVDSGPQHLGERDRDFLQQLRLAADQFLVVRPLNGSKRSGNAAQASATVIAGYHWFADWSRDTMISLPGLTLATGRFDEARSLLENFARYLERGMLPNRFPDSGEKLTDADYNTVDATLWYFHALDQYLRLSGDTSLLNTLYPALEEIIAWHQRGTRFGIRVDTRDGLLAAGEPGVQLTWMDAKVDNWVVTPRIGKPVEINALWYNALRLMEEWAASQGKDPQPYGAAAARCRESFNQRFWQEASGYLADVIDSPDGDDSSLRPNQVFAISLPHPVLDPAHWQPVLDTLTRHLLTPLGLRSLNQEHPAYQGHYTGDVRARDGAYHQGTVWAWLIGPYLDARLRVSGSADERARAQEEARCLGILAAFRDHLEQEGLGSISEIFDGEAPYTPRGCIAQAWSVAEVLRLWARCHHLAPTPETRAAPTSKTRGRRVRAV